MKNVVGIIVTSVFLLLPALLFAVEAKPTMAPLCAGCHQPETGVLMGTLDNISYKADTLQLDLVSGSSGRSSAPFRTAVKSFSPRTPNETAPPPA